MNGHLEVVGELLLNRFGQTDMIGWIYSVAGSLTGVTRGGQKLYAPPRAPQTPPNAPDS